MAKFLHSRLFSSYSISSRIPYDRYLRFQEKARNQRMESILFLEHNPCLTGGSTAKAENLLSKEETLSAAGVGLFLLQRGGDYTAHEPGQVVGYPHIDLKKRDIRLGDYLAALTISIRNAVLEIWNVELLENRESPGLYLKENPKKKLVSLGVYAKSHFTSFGFALNGINTLETFKHIHPCGALSSDVVSLQILGKVRDWEMEKQRFMGAFLFHLDALLSK